ncbi:MAG: HypC/HybG/HupF family hydrogenase formation chaperone [Gemmatimonadota bacterium]
MCLGIPGEILETHAGDLGLRMGTVRFGGAEREVCLEYVPDVQVGDYVIVHVGVAISKVSEEEAQEVFGYLQEIQALAELEDTQGPDAVRRANRATPGANPA